MNLGWKMGFSPELIPFPFGADSDKGTDPGFFFSLSLTL